MNICCKKLFVAIFASFCMAGVANAVDLVGTVSVNQTSETAANAKINATNLARRQILFNVLSKYAPNEELNTLVYDTDSDELMNLIASTSVANEQISSDTYSANITMNIDNVAAKRWLDSHGIRNWVPLKDYVEKFTVFIVVPNGLVDWAELKRITRAEKIDIETQSMTGNQIVAKLPLNYRARFTATVREMGWKYADNGGVLQLWK